MSMDLQSDIYSALYDLAMLCLNPGHDPLVTTIPAIPIVQDQQDHAAPARGRFVAIQGSPSLEPLGSMEFRALTDTFGFGGPLPPGRRGDIQAYKATAVLWEVNGNGSALQRIRDYSETEIAKDLLDLTSVSILEFGPVVEMPIHLDNRWIPQSRMEVNLTIASKTEEFVHIIETVDYTGP